MSYHPRPYIFRDKKNRDMWPEVCADEAAARKFASGWNQAAVACNRADKCVYSIETPSGRIFDLIVPVAPEVDSAN